MIPHNSPLLLPKKVSLIPVGVSSSHKAFEILTSDLQFHARSVNESNFSQETFSPFVSSKSDADFASMYAISLLAKNLLVVCFNDCAPVVTS